MSQASRQHFDVKLVNGVAVVLFQNTPTLFEHKDVQEVSQQLNELVEGQGQTKLVINLSDLQYLSSSMLGELIALHKKLARVGGQIKLCCVLPVLMDIIRVTRIDKMFSIYATEQAALDSF